MQRKDVKHTIGISSCPPGDVFFYFLKGGTPYKMCGRVGDSPLVGSGLYANQWAGASCTGHGESLLKVILSREVVNCIERGDSPTEACSRTISKMAELTGGYGGVICLDKFGEIGLTFNTKHMVWASLKNGLLKFGIDPGEEIEEVYKE